MDHNHMQPPAAAIPATGETAKAIISHSAQQRILTSMPREAPPHRPAFRLETAGENWRIFDGDRALALFRPTSLDIWAFAPFAPDEIANPEPPGKVVDVHTVHNTYLNFGVSGWPRHWSGKPLTWNWRRAAGPELETEVTLAGPDDENCVWRLTITYDPAWGRYRYRVAIDARKLDPSGFEAFNMMIAGALVERPEQCRWSHSIWESPDGTLRRLVHSNALLFCSDYGNARESHGPWRHRNLPYPSAWVAYAAHPTFNPALLIQHTNVPLLGATCDMLFDEHIIWNGAGQDNLGDDGFFHFKMELEFVNLPAELAKDLLAQAVDPVRPKSWRHQELALPFHVGRSNHFEAVLDLWGPQESPLFRIPNSPDGAVVWDRSGRDGSRSIRLHTTAAGRPLQLFPEGAVCRVRPHSRCRLSGWIRTAETTGQARVLLQAYAYRYGNILNAAATPAITGTTDWTFVAVDLDCGDAAYVMPQLELIGSGTAWFTDLLLETA